MAWQDAAPCFIYGKERVNMEEIKGKFATAISYAKVIDENARGQIARMCDYDFTKGSRIRIMPDVHAGKGCIIGTTI